jgi:hypothetical protein
LFLYADDIREGLACQFKKGRILSEGQNCFPKKGYGTGLEMMVSPAK